MQSNIRQFIRKFGYIFLRGAIVGLPFVLSLMTVIFLTTILSTQGNILLIVLTILGLIGLIFFGIKTVYVSLISQEYLYQVFLMIEKTKGEITEDTLLASKKKFKKWFMVSTIIVVIFIVLFFLLRLLGL